MPIRLETLSPQIHQITLNRPDRSGAFSLELLQGFRASLDQVRQTPEGLVLLIRSKGRNFCGGLDLEEASRSEDHAREMPRLVTEILAGLRRLPQVVVTIAQGAARAGGAAVAVASDLVVASENFTPAFPEVRRGLAPVLLFPLLRRRLPISALNELLLTGEPIDAHRARQLGLAHRVVAEDCLEETAMTLIEPILRADPESIRTAKELILVQETAAAGCSLEEEFARSLENHLRCWNSPSGREGVTAFLEKRAPDFS